MQSKSLRNLIKLVAAEKNLHLLIARVAADADLLKTTRDFYAEGTGGGAFLDHQVRQLCDASLLPLEIFQERLGKVAHALNLSAPQPQEDYYGILGLDNGAGILEIKAAFRRLSFACHPDRNPRDPEAGERFRKLHRAYRILSNVETKQKYDDSLVAPTWIEPLPVAEQEAKAPQWQWNKLHRAWPIALFVLFLVFLSFLVDFQTWQTSRYYHGRSDNRVSVGGMAYPPLTLDPAGQEKFIPWEHLKMKSVWTKKNLESSPLPMPLFNCLQEVGSRLGPRVKPQRAPEVPTGSTPSVVVAQNHPDTPGIPQVADHPDRSAGHGVGLPALERSSPESTGTSKAPEKEATPPTPGVPPLKVERALASHPESEKPVKEEPAGGKEATMGSGRTKAGIAEKPPTEPSRSAVIPPVERSSGGVPKRASEGQAVKRMESAVDPHAEKSREVQPASAGKEESDASAILSVEEMNRTLEGFLKLYVKAYKSRNTKTFFNLFDPEATENGEPLKNLRTLYVENFQKAEHIDYSIKLSGWSVHKEHIKIDADFRLAVKLAGESPMDATGEMQMILARRGHDLKVKRLDYSFH
ncbi:J domain-containing protein [Desulforhabdus sp. TSK]|uniref:J domain-containing protein n=1 Tax=Desulforhabdus sp. TSK TaxID=2925014 RepID=UPI001FC8CC51|nr:J domain-containing protein [Desulforhabdus sp. TSK]